MKSKIHPQYHDKAKVICACGKTFTVGSTVPEINIELCSECHPFYTGKQKLVDTAGRVEKFRARAAKKTTHVAKKVKKAKAAKKKAEKK